MTNGDLKAERFESDLTPACLHMVMAARLRVMAAEADLLGCYVREGTEMRTYLERLAASMRGRADALVRNIPF